MTRARLVLPGGRRTGQVHFYGSAGAGKGRKTESVLGTGDRPQILSTPLVLGSKTNRIHQHPKTWPGVQARHPSSDPVGACANHTRRRLHRESPRSHCARAPPAPGTATLGLRWRGQGCWAWGEEKKSEGGLRSAPARVQSLCQAREEQRCGGPGCGLRRSRVT